MRASLLLLFLIHASATAGPFLADGNQHDGEAVTCDLPISEHLRNKVGRDGLGLCVFTAIEHAARWANEPALIGFRDYMTQKPGGGWPEKVDEMIPQFAASQHRPTPRYVQHTGGDAEFLRLALRTGRYVCVTYNGRDGVFYRGTIAHMVNLVHLTEKWAVVHDNNYPGQWLWMPPADFFERWRGSGGGWAIVLLNPGPPPIPVNRVAIEASFGSPLDSSAETSTNFGLDVARVPSNSSYRLNGKEVTRGEALSSFKGLTDDSGKLRLTIVGDADLRRRVRDDLANHPTLIKLGDRLLVQDYPPEHWAVAGVGFAAGITLQPAPDAAGKAPVLIRLPTYSGPEALAGAIRQADPNYRPERDPTPGKIDPSKTLDAFRSTPELWVLGGLGLLVLLYRRKGKS